MKQYITNAIVALSLSVTNLATAQDEQPAKDTSKSSSVKQFKDKYVIECGDLSVCGVSANTICTEGYDVNYITGSNTNYTMVIKCKAETATIPTPTTVTVPVTVTVPNQEPILEPEPEPEPESEEPSNGLGLRIAGSIFLADSTVGLLASPVYCDSLSYDENGYFDSEYYNSCMGIMVPVVVTEAILGAVLLSSGIIKKAVVTRKLNKKFSINGTNVLVRF